MNEAGRKKKCRVLQRKLQSQLRRFNEVGVELEDIGPSSPKTLTVVQRAGRIYRSIGKTLRKARRYNCSFAPKD